LDWELDWAWLWAREWAAFRSAGCRPLVDCRHSRPRSASDRRLHTIPL